MNKLGISKISKITAGALSLALILSLPAGAALAQSHHGGHGGGGHVSGGHMGGGHFSGGGHAAYARTSYAHGGYSHTGYGVRTGLRSYGHGYGGGYGGHLGTRYLWGGLPFYFYGGYYYGDCGWVREQAEETGSPYWWHRYHICRAY